MPLTEPAPVTMHTLSFKEGLVLVKCWKIWFTRSVAMLKKEDVCV
jgi:hypothetical protein